MGELLKIKGIGPKIEKYFANLGIDNINDLLNFFPRDYETYDDPINIIDLETQNISTIEAMVHTKPQVFRKGRVTITSVWLDDGTGRIRAFWFNVPYISKSLKLGEKYIFRGRVSRTKNGIALSQCKIYTKQNYEGLKGNLNPVYSLTKGLTNNTIKKTVKEILDMADCKNAYEDYLDEGIKKRRRLCDLEYAYKHIHFPNDFEDMKVARQRLVYDELFLFSLATILNKREKIQNGRTELKNASIEELSKEISNLPFELTNGQKDAINDVIKDLNTSKKMNRLLEGDVGSGKTMVAILTALLFAKRKIQTAFMVPTEVLAEQHYNSIVSILSNVAHEVRDNRHCEPCDQHVGANFASPISVALLTGSTKAKDRKIILEKLKEGSIDILVGTHALFSNDVIYKDLGYCIIDEQHRFGVNQRKALEDRSNNANVLAMSATPIPRTLAMLLYADMDISKITDKPKDRIKIKNYVANINEREKAYRAIKKEIDLGHQAYVICPAIEKNDDEDIGSFANYQNVYDYSENLKSIFGKSVNIGVLHGKMKPNEKYEVMNEFKNGDIQILVATTVVEVGVDVPNATFIMIEDANAFGLAELHQLRGRVGRGSDQSYALFVNTMPNDKSSKRLKVLVDSNDGFYIAEEDLKLRGPGDIFGIKQSGDLDFKLADIYTDIELFKNASEDAKEFTNKKITLPLRAKLDEYLKLGLVI